MSWLTVAMLANFTSRGISWEGTPSNRTWPCQGRYSPLMSLDTVDFPQPEAPHQGDGAAAGQGKGEILDEGRGQPAVAEGHPRSSTWPESFSVMARCSPSS